MSQQYILIAIYLFSGINIYKLLLYYPEITWNLHNKNYTCTIMFSTALSLGFFHRLCSLQTSLIIHVHSFYCGLITTFVGLLTNISAIPALWYVYFSAAWLSKHSFPQAQINPFSKFWACYYLVKAKPSHQGTAPSLPPNIHNHDSNTIVPDSDIRIIFDSLSSQGPCPAIH